MSKMIQVRNVPDRLHRELMKRARTRGLTLTGYIQDILEREVSKPPVDEVFEWISARAPVTVDVPAAELIRQERADRDAS